MMEAETEMICFKDAWKGHDQGRQGTTRRWKQGQETNPPTSRPGAKAERIGPAENLALSQWDWFHTSDLTTIGEQIYVVSATVFVIICHSNNGN